MFKKFLGSKKESHRIRSEEKAAAKGYQSQTSLLSLSLSSGKRMKTGRKATRNRTREGVLGLTFLCVCVCSRAAFFSSRSACDVCSVSRETSKKVRVCKNYEEISTKKIVKKGKKAGKRRDALRAREEKINTKLSFL
jgi:hypothetical protein